MKFKLFLWALFFGPILSMDNGPLTNWGGLSVTAQSDSADKFHLVHDSSKAHEIELSKMPRFKDIHEVEVKLQELNWYQYEQYVKTRDYVESIVERVLELDREAYFELCNVKFDLKPAECASAEEAHFIQLVNQKFNENLANFKHQWLSHCFAGGGQMKQDLRGYRVGELYVRFLATRCETQEELKALLDEKEKHFPKLKFIREYLDKQPAAWAVIKNSGKDVACAVHRDIWTQNLMDEFRKRVHEKQFNKDYLQAVEYGKKGEFANLRQLLKSKMGEYRCWQNKLLQDVYNKYRKQALATEAQPSGSSSSDEAAEMNSDALAKNEETKDVTDVAEKTKQRDQEVEAFEIATLELDLALGDSDSQVDLILTDRGEALANTVGIDYERLTTFAGSQEQIDLRNELIAQLNNFAEWLETSDSDFAYKIKAIKTDLLKAVECELLGDDLGYCKNLLLLAKDVYILRRFLLFPIYKTVDIVESAFQDPKAFLGERITNIKELGLALGRLTGAMIYQSELVKATIEGKDPQEMLAALRKLENPFANTKQLIDNLKSLSLSDIETIISEGSVDCFAGRLTKIGIQNLAGRLHKTFQGFQYGDLYNLLHGVGRVESAGQKAGRWVQAGDVQIFIPDVKLFAGYGVAQGASTAPAVSSSLAQLRREIISVINRPGPLHSFDPAAPLQISARSFCQEITAATGSATVINPNLQLFAQSQGGVCEFGIVTSRGKHYLTPKALMDHVSIDHVNVKELAKKFDGQIASLDKSNIFPGFDGEIYFDYGHGNPLIRYQCGKNLIVGLVGSHIDVNWNLLKSKAYDIRNLVFDTNGCYKCEWSFGDKSLWKNGDKLWKESSCFPRHWDHDKIFQKVLESIKSCEMPTLQDNGKLQVRGKTSEGIWIDSILEVNGSKAKVVSYYPIVGK